MSPLTMCLPDTVPDGHSPEPHRQRVSVARRPPRRRLQPAQQPSPPAQLPRGQSPLLLQPGSRSGQTTTVEHARQPCY